MSYPVLEVVPRLKELFLEKNKVILQAPPGAGKSTVLPLQLLEEPWLAGKKIIMLEPRRLAARSVAMRMASLLNEEPGETVGYRVRFETRVSERTRLEVVTEGILTRMIQTDNALEDVGLLIFDEFHERSLQADLALTLGLQVQQLLREDLRLLVMSATLDVEGIAAALGNAPVVTAQGRQFPVTVHYYNPDPDAPLVVRVQKAIRKAFTSHDGDILVFLPGTADIARVAQSLENENLDARIHPLYGDLSFQKQQEAILPAPAGVRKIVLATSIAETSLTIEGITVVIDSGYSRVPRFDPRSGFSRLETVRVTKDAADQRAGRAGRLGPGTCYRLWSETIHMNLVPRRDPEILEADLASLVLELSQWGVRNMSELTWITPPPPGAVSQAKDLLQHLGALEQEAITDRGKKMLRLPTHPRIAHMLLEAMDTPGYQLLAADIAALLEERDPLPKEAGADITLRIEALHRWRSGEKVNAEKRTLERIDRLSKAWLKLLKGDAQPVTFSDTDIGRFVLCAYPERIAKQTERHSERYKLANGRPVRLPPHDPLVRETWLAVAHLDAGVAEGRIFLAAPLSEEDIVLHAREFEITRWDHEREMVVTLKEQRIGNLVMSVKQVPEVDPAQRIKVLCELIRERGMNMLDWQELHRQWQARVLSLRTWRPEEDWPDVSDDHLLETLESWLAPFLNEAYKKIDLQRVDLHAALAAILPWELNNRMEKLVPARIEVPSGSMIKVKYFTDGRPPIMEVRLQEVFGWLETPAVNEGRNSVVLHLLSPGFKPVQVTQDLKSFWTNTYHEVRKELRTQYPKHSWPEDPWNAQAVRGVSRKKN